MLERVNQTIQAHGELGQRDPFSRFWGMNSTMGAATIVLHDS
jgi:hypothetical protein